MRASTLFGGGDQIGDYVLAPDLGNIFVNGVKEYLRTGFLADAASYPNAATKKHLQAVGLASTNATAIAATGIADDGASTIVVAYGNSTNVLVSTNGGQTWSTVAHNCGAPVTSVVHTGARFIAFGNDASTIKAAYSASGTTWTAGGTLATSATSSTARAAWNGTVAMVVVNGGTVAATTTDGTTLTSRTITTLSAQPSIGVKSGAFLFGAGGASTLYSTTDGTSPVTRTIPSAMATNGLSIAGTAVNWVVQSATSGQVLTSSDLTTWVVRSLPGFASSKFLGRLTYGAGRVYVSADSLPQLIYSDDGVMWQSKSITSSPASSSAWIVSPNGKVFVNSGANTTASILYTADFNVADYVGVSIASIGSGTASINSQVLYVRIK